MVEKSKFQHKQVTKQEQRLIQRFNELFINYRGNYIFQKEDGSYVNSICFKKKLTDKEILNHIRGIDTVGIFAGQQTCKFILFDVDMADKSEKEKQIAVNKIKNELELIGIPRYFIHTIFSGSKGYHCCLFFDDLIHNNYVKSLYEYILQKTQYNKHEVELRPLHNVGVKLPLSYNKKTNKFCCFVDDNFKVIKDKEYIHKIIPYSRDIFIEIMHDVESEYKQQKKIDSIKTKLKDNYKQPKVYDDYYDKDFTIDKAKELERNGLIHKGSRKNSLVKLAIYYHTIGYEYDDIIANLTEWLGMQDTKMYKTKWEDCLKDINNITKWVIKKNAMFVNKKLNIEVYDEEIEKIMDLNRFYQQVVMYALLCHSKRYASSTGVFYMSSFQVMKSTCIEDKNTMGRIVTELEKLGYIEIIDRNIQQGLKKIPNKYKVLIRADENIKQSKINVQSDVINLMDNYVKNINEKYTKKELKKKLNKRCYTRIINNGDVKYKNKKVG